MKKTIENWYTAKGHLWNDPRGVECVEKCPSTHLGDVAGGVRVCNKCSEYEDLAHCQMCGSSNKCILCDNGRLVEEADGTTVIHCVSSCRPGTYATMVTRKDIPGFPELEIPTCSPCSENCANCSSAKVCLKCNALFYLRVKKSGVHEYCDGKCTLSSVFQTLDSKCINCDDKMNGCVECSDDETCDQRVSPGCEYKTKCSKCQTGYILDQSGFCCLISNCSSCSSYDQKVCLKCEGEYTLWKALEAGESDQCITANACQSKSFGGHGFYNKELFLKPLTAGQELLDGLKNGTLETVTDSQGEGIWIKFINKSPFNLRAYL